MTMFVVGGGGGVKLVTSFERGLSSTHVTTHVTSSNRDTIGIVQKQFDPRENGQDPEPFFGTGLQIHPHRFAGAPPHGQPWIGHLFMI